MHCAALTPPLTTRMPKLRLWVGMGGFGIGVVFSKGYLFLFLILSVVTTTSPITPIKGVPKMNQSSVMCDRNLKCPCEPAMPTIKRKHPKIVIPVNNTVNAFISIYSIAGRFSNFCLYRLIISKYLDLLLSFAQFLSYASHNTRLSS